MAFVSITVDTGNMSALLNRVSHIGEDMSDPMRKAGILILKRAMDHFTQEMGPPWSGGKWKALSKATERSRRKGRKNRGNKILQDSARLRNSVSPAQKDGNIFRLENTSVEVGTNVEYAAIHQYGGVIYCKPRDITVFLRTTRSGGLKSQKGYPNLAVFAKRSHKLQTGSITSRTGYYKIVIPARPFLWLSEEDEEAVADIFSGWIQKTFGGH